MGRIYDSVLDLVGQTPLLRLRRLPQAGSATVLAKLEAANPGGSVKDRVALAMVQDAEAQGKLLPGGTIMEASAGNVGVALALVAACRGYRFIAILPESAGLDHRKVLSRYGAQVLVTPASQGMLGAVTAAQRLVAENPDYFWPRPFDNPANPQTHERTTGRELLEATDGNIDAFVAGIGTGGTITGVGQALKKAIPGVRVIGVEPARSAVLGGGRPGHHNIPGLGAGFVPEVLRRELLDQVISVGDEEALETTGRLGREEGLLVGPSSGANVFAALKVAQELGAGRTVVTVLPDAGGRYLGFQ